MMKALGLTRLDAFRRADLTPELRKTSGLTAEDEYRLTACAELSRLGVPYEAAQAFTLSGAIGSASELAALSLAEVERLLAEAPVRRLLPAEFKFDRTALEDWLRRVVPLTADEAAPGRSAVAESDAATFSLDEDLPLAAEDVVLTTDKLAPMLTTLKERWTRNEAAIETLTRPNSAPVEAAVLRGILSDLQGGIASALDAVLAPAAGEIHAAEEAAAGSLADEALDPAVEVVRLQGELNRIEASIDALQSVSASGSEETSPAAATEAGPSERETSPRGE
jgi:hypothetical protein